MGSTDQTSLSENGINLALDDAFDEAVDDNLPEFSSEAIRFEITRNKEVASALANGADDFYENVDLQTDDPHASVSTIDIDAPLSPASEAWTNVRASKNSSAHASGEPHAKNPVITKPFDDSQLCLRLASSKGTHGCRGKFISQHFASCHDWLLVREYVPRRCAVFVL